MIKMTIYALLRKKVIWFLEKFNLNIEKEQIILFSYILIWYQLGHMVTHFMEGAEGLILSTFTIVMPDIFSIVFKRDIQIFFLGRLNSFLLLV